MLKRLLSLTVVAVCLMAVAIPSHASDFALFSKSDDNGNGATSQSAAVTITLTFGNHNTYVLSTATGYQYQADLTAPGNFAPADDGNCPNAVQCYWNQGWFSLGSGQKVLLPNSNYLVGNLGLASYHDYFSFDTAATDKNGNVLTNADLASGITSAQYTATLFETSGAGSVTLYLSATTLSSQYFNDFNNSHVGDVNAYNDLANGIGDPTKRYGSSTFNIPGNPTNGAQLNMNINSSLLANQLFLALNNTNGASDAHVFTMGGSLVNNASAVPEPASILLLTAGIGGLCMRRRTK